MRHRPADPHDVGHQGGVIAIVPAGMIAHDIDHWGGSAPGIVKIGHAVGEAGPQMQQGRCRFSRHAAIAIGRARHHAFEQAQHRTDRTFVQRRHEMHFRCAGIGEANIDPGGGQCLDHTVGAVHAIPLFFRSWARAGKKARNKKAKKERPRLFRGAAFRIVVVTGAPLRADPAGSENPVPGTLYGMTMRHWITSFS